MYEYKKINPSLYDSPEAAANSWAREGWRVAGVIPPPCGREGNGLTYTFLLERGIDTNIEGEAQEGTIRHLIDYLGSVPPALWDKPYSILVEQSTSLRDLDMGPHLRIALKVDDRVLVLAPETTVWVR